MSLPSGHTQGVGECLHPMGLDAVSGKDLSGVTLSRDSDCAGSRR